MKINKKGFTLVELLVVIAIITVLVSITLPIFSNQIETTKEKSDTTLMSNACALASSYETSKTEINGKLITKYTENNPLYYSTSGDLTSEVPNAYGEGTSKDNSTSYTSCNGSYISSYDYTNSVIKIFYKDGTLNIKWIDVDEAKNSSGGQEPEIPDTPTPSGDTVTIAGQKVKYTDYPERPKNSEENINLNVGDIYTYNDTIYVCVAKPQGVGYWYYITPNDEAAYWYFTTFTNKVWHLNDANNEGKLLDKTINRGDVFDDGKDLYVCVQVNANYGLLIPSLNSQDWIKINNVYYNAN